jgi:transaldolase
VDDVSVWLDPTAAIAERSVHEWIERGVVTGIGPSPAPGRPRAARWARWLRAAHARSAGADGLVRVADPAAARNAVVGLPLTPSGLTALERHVAAGRSAAIGPVVSVADARAAAEAHLSALERRQASGDPVGGVVSLAWCPVAAIDEHADARLTAAPELRGWVGSAVAQLAYAETYRALSGERWKRLRREGALRQRTAMRASPAAPLERLALPGAVLAVAEDELDAIADLTPCDEPDETEAAWVLAEARRAGVDLAALRPLAAAPPARPPRAA